MSPRGLPIFLRGEALRRYTLWLLAGLEERACSNPTDRDVDAADRLDERREDDGHWAPTRVRSRDGEYVLDLISKPGSGCKLAPSRTLPVIYMEPGNVLWCSRPARDQVNM